MQCNLPRRSLRTRLLASLLACGLSTAAHAVDAVVNFSELMYHPRDGELEWVELHNMMSVDVDLSEWRLSGGVDFAFPRGTVIPGGGYLVIEGEGGGAGAHLGPFTGRLDNNGERVRLRNNSDRLMDEVEYGDSGRWPVAADGPGASLAKRSPRLASDLPENWTWSRAAGGTPGAANTNNQALPLQLSEVSSASTPLFQVELINAGGSAVQTDGVIIENPATAGGGTHTLPPGVLNSGERLVIDENTLGFRVADEGRLFLTTAGASHILDAVRVKNRNLARREGATTDDRFLSPDVPTPGAPNTFAIEDAIVINEIMYHYRPQPERRSPAQPYAEIGEEWIELYHRGAAPVNLTGWSIDGTIAFQFPDETVMNPGDYLVIANNPAALALKHPTITIAGEFSGNLNNDHGYLRLENAVQNPVDEVHYYDGGRWPGAADGEGSSLELRDPDADNTVAEAWAASDESARGIWQTYTYSARGQALSGSDPSTYHEFICGLLDGGECLLDDLSVIEDPTGSARQLIQNGNFDSSRPGIPPARWRLVGTHGMHGRSVVIENPDGPGNVLHLVATGPMWHTQNQAETTLKDGGQFVNINSSRVYEISFRAKWLTGSPHLNTRLYFNRTALTHVLEQPAVSGTPGAPNSTLVPNLGPTAEEFRHFPLRPSSGSATRVQARVSDPDGVASVTLHWSTNGSTYSQVAMSDQGAGLHLGSIPGQANNTKVQFFIEAEDQLGATATHPAAGPDSRALFRVGGEANPANPAQHIEIVMLPADEAILGQDVNVMSNHRLGATVIYEDEVFYDAGVRYKSSQRGRNNPTRRGFNVAFPADRKFRGVLTSIGLDRSGGWRFPSAPYGQDEIVIWHYMNRAGGIPAVHPDLIHVDGPGVPDGSAQLQLARFTNEFLDSQYDNGGDGSMHNYELIYYPTSTTGGPEGLKRPQPDSVTGVPVRSLGTSEEAYRYYFQLRNNQVRDDYAGMIGLCRFFSRDTNTVLANADQIIDVDQWLRCFAAVALGAVGDSYFDNGNAHNARFYHRPSDGRMLLFPWDMDFAFVKGATSSLTLNSDLNRLLGDPANRRLFWGHMQDIVSRAYRGAYMNTWINHYNSFLTGQNITSLGSFVQQRGAYALTQARLAVPGTNFSITTNGGNDFDSPDNPVVLEGKGWVTLRELRLAGASGALPLTWTDTTSWRVEIPLGPGVNNLTLEAIDFEGDLISSASIAITNTSTVVAAAPDNFALTELMYNPPEPDVDEIAAGFPDSEDFEFCEFHNFGAVTVDAGGVSFAEGIDFTIPPDTLLAPGERVVVVRNPGAFAERYGAAFPGVRVVGDYEASGTSFRNSGERVHILAGDGTTLLDFSYGDSAPWPSSADGAGYSLVPIAPEHAGFDASNPAHWRTSAAPGGHPGASDAFSFPEWSATNGDPAPLDDPENDNLVALVEYTTGGSPASRDPSPAVEIDPARINEFSTVIVVGADDTIIGAEVSDDLVSWSDTDILYAGTVNNGDGTRTVIFEQTAGSSARFARFLYSLRE